MADAPGAIAAASKPMRMATMTSNAIEPQEEARAAKDSTRLVARFATGEASFIFGQIRTSRKSLSQAYLKAGSFLRQRWQLTASAWKDAGALRPDPRESCRRQT